MASQQPDRIPTLWQGVQWARRPGVAGGGTSRARLTWRALRATLQHGRSLRRWMSVVYELHARSIVRDLPAEYLRAIRPYVHGGTGFAERVVQLTDHFDWLETAFFPKAFEQIASGQPLVVMELAPPRGYDFMRLQLRQAPPQSPEGELLLTLTLQRSADIQHKPQPIEAGALAFSRFRVEGVPCMVIGGVRGQRHPVQRASPVEIGQALQGWKPSVLMVRVAQELARYWNLHLLGLDPRAHRLHGWSYRWNRRAREAVERIQGSYQALWDHFEAGKGPPGWVIVPINSDEKLAATALSPEKRARQTLRADFWIRTRNALRVQLRQLLVRPDRDAELSRVTQAMESSSALHDDMFDDSDDVVVPSRVLQTGPGSLM
jgi:uncharacterized protein VirK/YbjX